MLLPSTACDDCVMQPRLIHAGLALVTWFDLPPCHVLQTSRGATPSVRVPMAAPDALKVVGILPLLLLRAQTA